MHRDFYYPIFCVFLSKRCNSLLSQKSEWAAEIIDQSCLLMAIIIILLSMIHLCFYFKNSHNRLTVNEIPFHSLTRGLVQIKDSNQVNIGEYHSTATNYHFICVYFLLLFLSLATLCNKLNHRLEYLYKILFVALTCSKRFALQDICGLWLTPGGKKPQTVLSIVVKEEKQLW